MNHLRASSHIAVFARAWPFMASDSSKSVARHGGDERGAASAVATVPREAHPVGNTGITSNLRGSK